MSNRQIQPVVLKDLQKKMVMIAGPRQCGKTTLAKIIAGQSGWTHHYYNWDIDAHRLEVMKGELDATAHLWILDELHKYPRWRNWLKGKFDQFHPEHAFLITGSARLDAYSRGGDSLQGRYYMHRLHPFTLAELLQLKPNASLEAMFRCETSLAPSAVKAFSDLVTLGGFPEPLFSGSAREGARWRLAYGARLVQEDIRTLERIQDLARVELLLDRLPDTVGSVLSINSLREDLQVAFETARNWLLVLERLYMVFRLAPFGAPKIKAVKKEQKLYFWDWSRVTQESSRFENVMALHLLRFVHWREDVEGEKWELRYFRDVTGHEVDFILLRAGKPWAAIEAKLDDRPLDGNLNYLLERIQFPYAFQVSLNGKKDWEPPMINGCRVRILPAARFLANLP